MSKSNEDYDEVLNKIQIYSLDDEKLRFLGKMLNNDASLKIFQMISQKEMTANEISESTGLSLSLVIYHINKMINADISSISKNSTNSKNQPMKYYMAKFGMVILPNNASMKAKTSKSFSRSLRTIMKFAVIGTIGLTSWMVSALSGVFSQKISHADSDDSLLGQGLTSLTGTDVLFPVIIGLVAIVIGLATERILVSKKIQI